MASAELQTVIQMLRARPLGDRQSLDVAAMRAGMEQMTGLMPLPPGLSLELIEANGVAAEWVSASGAAADRAHRRAPEEGTGLNARGVASSVLLAASLVLGCARLRSAPAAETEPWLAWHAPLGREDGLVGRIYDTAERRFISPAEALGRARRSDFVLLGEKHDNPDHHRLQAWLIAALVHDGRRPAVAFEMIPRDRAGALGAALEAHPDDPDALGAALDWAQSGWPDFALYRPVFAAALASRLPIVPGDLARPEYARLRHGGLDALPQAERARLALDPPLSNEARRALADEVREGHCGMAPEAMVDAMIDVQRARDAALADALLGAASEDGAVLIAGAGHVRTDRGAPLYLARRAPQKRVLALAFAEVSSGPLETADPAERASQIGLGFDLVWFTPRVDDDDPCERFQHELEKLRAPRPAPQARVR